MCGAASGFFTVTTAPAVALPPGPVAVRVYSVDTDGMTAMVVLPVTTPTSWSMVSCVAPATLHTSVAESPGAIVAGDAENDEITTGCGEGACDAQPASRRRS